MLVCYKPELTKAWPRAMAEVTSPKRLAELTGLGYSTCCRIMRADPETLELRSETAAKLRRLVETYIESPAPAPARKHTRTSRAMPCTAAPPFFIIINDHRTPPLYHTRRPA